MDYILTFLSGGLLQLSWWQIVLVTLVITHITIVSVTVFLHRSQAHRGLDIHPAAMHFFRFWLWLTTSMVTKEWVAVHRKHHAKCETSEDPHSPVAHGIKKVLLEGRELYAQEAANLDTQAKYLEPIAGTVCNMMDPPQGCKFHPRCTHPRKDAACARITPPLEEKEPGHWVACIKQTPTAVSWADQQAAGATLEPERFIPLVALHSPRPRSSAPNPSN